MTWRSLADADFVGNGNWHSSEYEGFGVLAENVPSTGSSGYPAFAYNDLVFPADNGKEIYGVVTAKSAGLTFTPYEDTSFVASAGADGSYSFTYQLYVNGVATGSPQASSIVIGGATHTLTAANSSQAATSGTAAITQTHTLVGAGSSQSASSGTGAITSGTVHTLIGSGSSQSATSGTGAVSQAHVLVVASSTQNSTSSAGAISTGTGHILSAAACGQAAFSSTGAVAQTHALMAAPSVQDSTAAASSIVQRHLLAAANSSQAATSSAGAVSDGSVPSYVAGAAAGGKRAPRIQSGTRAAR